MSGAPDDKVYKFAAVPAGQDNYYHLEAPQRGYVGRVVVTQVSGTLGGFSFDLYNTELAEPGGSESIDAFDEPRLHPSVYRVVPTQTVASSSRTGALYGAAYPFRNLDPDDAGRKGRLVLRINPANTGDFHVGVSFVAPVLG